MTRPPTPRLGRAALVASVLATALWLAPTRAQHPAPPGSAPDDPKANVGQFFTIVEPINDEVIERIKVSAKPAIERAASAGLGRPILVFEVLAGESQPGRSSFGASSDLAEFLVRGLAGAQQTVAFVPKPLSGYAGLTALACDEVVMGPDATLGPLAPPGEPVTERVRAAARELAKSKGRDPDLLLGMLEPDADLRRVRTADRRIHYVLAANLDKFRETHVVEENQPAWEGGRRGILTAEQARGNGLARLLAEDRAEVARAYHFRSIIDDPTLGAPVSPVLIRIQEQIDQVKESYIRRRIAQAQKEQDNLIVFDLDSAGGIPEAADKIADAVTSLKDIKTVAYIDQKATGAATLVALACDEIVFRKGGRLGDFTEIHAGQGRPQPLGGRMTRVLADRAEELAKKKGHPAALARAMVDPSVAVFSARDKDTGSVAFVTQDQLAAEPQRFEKLDNIHPAGSALLVSDDEARPLGLARAVVKDLEELKITFNLGSKPLRMDAPTWVDSLVALLNTSWMSWLLLFVGMFMLILELKLPGVGLPAIISALAFLLFFWGHYLGGTADQLEILLFLVGLICLALELFVFPGFGVFGMSGIVLILVSVVMASHTFIWPTQDYEYRQMGRTLLQVTIAIVAVGAGAVVLGRYFPSLPLFNRMVLKPEPIGGDEIDPTAKPPLDPDGPLFYLIGEIGQTTTALKPTGKARFGEQLIDVTADGFYIEAGQPVEVVEVRGSRVVVKRTGPAPGEWPDEPLIG